MDTKRMSVFLSECAKNEVRKSASRNRRKRINRGKECCVCGFSYKPILQIHHIVPIKDGGDDSDENTLCTCPNCHKVLHKLYTFIKTDDEEESNKLSEYFKDNYPYEVYVAYLQTSVKCIERIAKCKI